MFRKVFCSKIGYMYLQNDKNEYKTWKLNKYLRKKIIITKKPTFMPYPPASLCIVRTKFCGGDISFRSFCVISVVGRRSPEPFNWDPP